MADKKDKVNHSEFHCHQQHAWGAQAIETSLKHLHTLPPIELTRENWKKRMELLSNENQPDD
jgi:hypothetical protein